jgi:hypothetical protein
MSEYFIDNRDPVFTSKKRFPGADLHLNSQVKLNLDGKKRLKTNYERAHSIESMEKIQHSPQYYSPMKQ